MKKTTWRRPASAPKDGRVIIADFGDGEAVSAAWNGAHGDWCVANLEISVHKGQHTDANFIGDYRDNSELKRWLPMPIPESAGSAGRVR